MPTETLKEMARRHARQQQALIYRQKEIIQRLAAAGESTELAEEILQSMKRTLAITLKELDWRNP